MCFVLRIRSVSVFKKTEMLFRQVSVAHKSTLTSCLNYEVRVPTGFTLTLIFDYESEGVLKMQTWIYSQ